jgi:hypothetical protein
LRHAERFEGGSIAQQGQVALVRIQSVNARMRSDDCQIALVGEPQDMAGRRIEIEVGQTVVHEIDALAAQPDATLVEFQLRGVRDGHSNAVRLEKPLSELKFRVQKLPARLDVDDCDGSQRRSPSRERPLALEHRNDLRLELSRARLCCEIVIDGRTTGYLCIVRRDVEEGAAGIGVDLDQPGPCRSDVEIEPHERACGAGLRLREVACATQYGFLVPRQARRRFDRVDDPPHLGHMA